MSAIDELRAADAGLPLGASNPDPPYVCFPLKCELPSTPDLTTFPEPLHTSDMPPPAIQPEPVRDLAFLGRAAGFQVRVTYSEGFVPHSAYGTPSAKAKKLWAVRLRHGDQCAVAVRENSAWHSFWTWSPRQTPRRAATLATFTQQLGTDY